MTLHHAEADLHIRYRLTFCFCFESSGSCIQRRTSVSTVVACRSAILARAWRLGIPSLGKPCCPWQLGDDKESDLPAASADIPKSLNVGQSNVNLIRGAGSLEMPRHHQAMLPFLTVRVLLHILFQ